MILAFGILLPVLAVSLWAYFRFRPAGTEVHKLWIYDVIVVGCVVVLCIAVTVYLRNEMVPGPDSAWWPVVAAIYWLVIFPIFLMVGGIIRYAIFSRSSARSER